MIDISGKYKPEGEFVIRQVEHDFLLIPVNNDTVALDSAFIMNESGAFIFDLLDGKTAGNEIIDKLCAAFEVSKDVAEVDFIQFLSDLDRSFHLIST